MPCPAMARGVSSLASVIRCAVYPNVLHGRSWQTLLGVLCLWVIALSGASAQFPKSGFSNAVVLAVQNRVEVARRGAEVWDPAYVAPTNQVLFPGDRLRTGQDSRALLRLSNLTD